MRLKNTILSIFLLTAMIVLNACKANGITTPAAVSTDVPAADIDLEENGGGDSASEAEETDGKIPLIFSHDGALDDIAAILYLHRCPQINIIGVVNSYGEQIPVESSDEWSRFLQGVLNLDEVPLAIGSAAPLDPAGYEFPIGWRNEANNFWGIELPASSVQIDEREGYQLIIDLVNGSPVKVTILATGALTDVALALQHDPQIKNKIERIVIMGGAFNVAGNLNGMAADVSNGVAEWNIFVDALAAKEVFNAGIPLTIMPLDGSESFWMTSEFTDQFLNSQDGETQFVSTLWQTASGKWGGNFLLWDILAAVALTDPQYFTWEYGTFDVINEAGDQYGRTIVIDPDNDANSFAANYDYDGVLTHLIDIMRK